MSVFKSIDYVAAVGRYLDGSLTLKTMKDDPDVKRLVLPLAVPIVFFVLSIIYCIVCQCVCICCSSQAKASKLRAKIEKQRLTGDVDEQTAQEYTKAQTKADKCAVLNLVFYCMYFVAPLLAMVALGMMGAALWNLLKTDYAHDLVQIPSKVMGNFDGILKQSDEFLGVLTHPQMSPEERQKLTVLFDMVNAPKTHFDTNIAVLSTAIPESSYYTEIQQDVNHIFKGLENGLANAFNHSYVSGEFASGLDVLKKDADALTSIAGYISSVKDNMYVKLMKTLFGGVAGIKQMLLDTIDVLRNMADLPIGKDVLDQLYDKIEAMPVDSDIYSIIEALLGNLPIDDLEATINQIKNGQFNIQKQFLGSENYVETTLRAQTAGAHFDTTAHGIKLTGMILKIMQDIAGLRMKDVYKLFDEEDYVPESLAGLFEVPEFAQGWQKIHSSYRTYVNNLKGTGSFFAKFNAGMSKYSLRYFTNALYFISFSICTLALFSLLFKCIPMLKRSPGQARARICCTPCGQCCMAITLIGFGASAIAFSAIVGVLAVLDDLSPALDMALSTYKSDIVKVQQKCQDVIQNFNGKLGQYGVKLGLQLNLDNSAELFEHSRFDLSADLNQMSFVAPYMQLLEPNALQSALCWQAYAQRYVVAAEAAHCTGTCVPNLDATKYACTVQFSGKTVEELNAGYDFTTVSAEAGNLVQMLSSLKMIFDMTGQYGVPDKDIMDMLLDLARDVEALPKNFQASFSFSERILSAFAEPSIALVNLLKINGKTPGELTAGLRASVESFISGFDGKLADVVAKVDFAAPALAQLVIPQLKATLESVLAPSGPPLLPAIKFVSGNAMTVSQMFVKVANNDTTGMGTPGLAGDWLVYLLLSLYEEAAAMADPRVLGCKIDFVIEKDSGGNPTGFDKNMTCARDYATATLPGGAKYAEMTDFDNFGAVADILKNKVISDGTTRVQFTNAYAVPNSKDTLALNDAVFNNASIRKRLGTYKDLDECKNDTAFGPLQDDVCAKIEPIIADIVAEYKKQLGDVFTMLKDAKLTFGTSADIIDIVAHLTYLMARACDPDGVCSSAQRPADNKLDLAEFAGRFADEFAVFDIIIADVVAQILAIFNKHLPEGIKNGKLCASVAKLVGPAVGLLQNQVCGDSMLSTHMLAQVKGAISYPFNKIAKTAFGTYNAYYVAWAALVWAPIMAAASWPFLRRSEDWHITRNGARNCCGCRKCCGCGKSRARQVAQPADDADSSMQLKESASTVVLQING